MLVIALAQWQESDIGHKSYGAFSRVSSINAMRHLYYIYMTYIYVVDINVEQLTELMTLQFFQIINSSGGNT